MLMGLGTASAYGNWLRLNRQLTEIMIDHGIKTLGITGGIYWQSMSNEDR